MYTLGMTQRPANENISTAITTITMGRPGATTIGVIVEHLAATIPGSDHITHELVRTADEIRRVEDLMDNVSARIRQWRVYLEPAINHMVDGFAITADNYAGAIGTPEARMYHDAMVAGHQEILDALTGPIGNMIGTQVYRSLRRAIIDQVFLVREHRRMLERLRLLVAELESMAV